MVGLPYARRTVDAEDGKQEVVPDPTVHCQWEREMQRSMGGVRVQFSGTGSGRDCGGSHPLAEEGDRAQMLERCNGEVRSNF